MHLNNRQKRYLKGKAHALSPAVTVGNRGLTKSVRVEIGNALERHELIKVKIPAGARGDRQALADHLSASISAETIALTGRVVILFKITPKKKDSLGTLLDKMG